jgi:glycosyltransferase involved in cell wall biosynthesis
MKVVICCNHSYPHCGGSETVIKNMAEYGVYYGHKVIVLSRTVKDPFKHNGVKYQPCPANADQFLNHLKKIDPDHVHVYSDCFTYWPDILKNAENIKATKSIALVGMNYMLQSQGRLKQFVKKHHQFTVITHSDKYVDYKKCQVKNIPVTVIPNGVDVREFDNNQETFLKKDKYNILCVSNFFPGKGQEHLIHILKLLANKRDDFRAIFMSSTVNFPYSCILSRAAKRALESSSFDYKFYVDKDREKVVAAFNEADVFAFPTQKEVAPLVALEAQASRTPWVSLPVGNMRELRGGIIIPYHSIDQHGYARYSHDTYEKFVEEIDNLLNNDFSRQILGDEGRQQVLDNYDWSIIGQKYNEVFTS